MLMNVLNAQRAITMILATYWRRRSGKRSLMTVSWVQAASIRIEGKMFDDLRRDYRAMSCMIFALQHLKRSPKTLLNLGRF